MTAKEAGFLLLTSHLGNPDRRPLTVAQFRDLTKKMANMQKPTEDRDLKAEDLYRIGCSSEMAVRIVALLSQTQQLQWYLTKAKEAGCRALTRVSNRYPAALRKRLGLDSPGCIWAKGDLSVLENKKIALVGSRDLYSPNRSFAREVGKQAALQGYALVSGNARGADREGQEACLSAGGQVISVVADSLADKPVRPGVLYLSEDAFEEGFSTYRALSRNRLIHSLGKATFVAQCSWGRGGTWNGTNRNLQHKWSPVYIFDDGSPASERLQQLGARAVKEETLACLNNLI